ncbi:phosphoinositide 3-kinase, partial [Genlisea aurea]
MTGNEFRFFLSCDINLPVTFKIERLEGKLLPRRPPDSVDGDYTIEERNPELYVETLLYIDGEPFGLPMRTRLESVGPSYCWNELITLSTKYRDLTANSQLAVTVFDVSNGNNGEVVGGASIHLFNMKKQLKTGKHKLRLWAGKEADGSINTTTPGKVPKQERGELERIEKLVNKYERGQIQRVDWLDRLAFKAMEKIKDRENLKNENTHFYVAVDFCSFEHRVVFQ